MLTKETDEMGGGIEMQPFRNLVYTQYRIRQQPFGFREQFLMDIRFGGRAERVFDDFIQVIGCDA